ncbi:hypothetical protein IEQ34_022286 [Dendrobium chrysotoxum]|uniref:Uncharacterized protein n=1 Tax=Dendrobium chrysotoxum TaxID=161865 RepID=A0AAV7FWP5_DENCH|nr:hypothetical protein IEQ34_022286 [Dendrobium chrysotoxum]
MAENVELIMEGKKIKAVGGGHKNIKNPVKCRPKGISNARVKGHWEKRRTKKSKPKDNKTPT